MDNNTSKFKADILKDIGRVITSPDLEHRVLIVRDEEGKTKVSLQVWWKDEIGAFNPGKGYFLKGRRAMSLSKLMKQSLKEKGVEFTSHITNTQKHVVTCKNCVVFISKLWRKSEDEEWIFGKDVAINSDKAEELATLLYTAGAMIIHSK